MATEYPESFDEDDDYYPDEDNNYGFDAYIDGTEYPESFDEDDDEYRESEDQQNESAETNISNNESISSNVIVTPNGTTTWLPKIPESMRIEVGTQYENYKQAKCAYETYAEASGFSARLATSRLYDDKSVKKKYMICSRSGKYKKRVDHTLNVHGLERKRRNSSYKVTECGACIIFFREHHSTLFTVIEHREEHNHPLNDSEFNRMSRKRRRLKFSDQQFLVQAASMSIGPTRAHGIKANTKGGYEAMTPTKIDYKNFWRSFVNFVGDKDAQCIVDEMTFRKSNFPNYSFEYSLEGHELSGMFWADEVAKANYKEFSDVISFDATFRHNKYNMVFIPFTAIDHHKRSVNVGAALLAKETIEGYTWLLKAFLKAHETAPRLVLSDQDPAMKQAIATVFTNSTHRLCMWHIMNKMRLKVNQELIKNTDFKKKINKLVWNVFLQPHEFEIGWTTLMEEYNLTGHRWLNKKYEARESWIPAYFKHIPNCGLMKTTSRSESSNSFFNAFSRHGNMLVNFMMNFDTAIEKQRMEQRSLDQFTSNTRPALTTETEIEVHASKCYTRTVFQEVQKEIKKAVVKCYQLEMTEENGVEICTIVQKSKQSGSKKVNKVEYIKESNSFKCPCDNFNRCGLLCCHIFRVMLNYDFSEIPSQYVLRRWCKNIISADHQRTRHGWAQKDNESAALVNQAHSYTDYCIDKYVSDPSRLKAYVEKLRLLKEECEMESTNKSDERTKAETFKALLGVTVPDDIQIHVPTGIRNKGTTRTRRIVGAAEKAIISSEKKARRCSGCDKHVTGHNFRTCPDRKQREANT